MSEAREAILAAVDAATEGRAPAPHPGRLRLPDPCEEPLPRFLRNFEHAGGETPFLGAESAPAARLESLLLAEGIPIPGGVAVSHGLSPELLPASLAAPNASARPRQARAGVVEAAAAAAECGSLLLLPSGGRRAQLLPPLVYVWVRRSRVFHTLEEAFAMIQASGLPEAAFLHSGPSASADIGGTVARGVHGPGRIVALPYAREEAPRSR